MFKIMSICKGGGYKYCRTEPPHPKRNVAGLYPLHRVLMENKIGRILDRNEIVHHINEDKSDDNIENLELISRSEHSKKHVKDKVKPSTILTCPCGKIFEIKLLSQLKHRLAKSKSSKLYCSSKCGAFKKYK